MKDVESTYSAEAMARANRMASAREQSRLSQDALAAMWQEIHGDHFAGVTDGKPIVLGKTNIPAVARTCRTCGLPDPRRNPYCFCRRPE